MARLKDYIKQAQKDIARGNATVEEILGQINPPPESETKELVKSSKTLGEQLFKVAIREFDQAKQDVIIATITGELKLLEEAKQVIETATLQKEYYERVIAAIRAGHFTVTERGHLILNGKLMLGRHQPPGTITYGGVDPRLHL